MMSRRFLLNLSLVAILVVVGWARLHIGAGQVLFVGQSQVRRSYAFLPTPPEPTLISAPATYASASAALAERVSAQAAIVLDRDSKRVLWQKNPDQPCYPASTTKIITALVARQLYALDDVITITNQDLQYGQNLAWTAGDEVAVVDVLRALLIVSANEAGMILADHAPGGYDNFIQLMNRQANELGLTGSHFVNPQGFDASEQRTTPHDLAIASLELLRDPVLAEIVQTVETQITTRGGRVLTLHNTNRLLTTSNLDYQVKGIKTGTTDLANEALVSYLEKDGHGLLVVVLSAQNRYNDTIAIADFEWGNHVWQPTAAN